MQMLVIIALFQLTASFEGNIKAMENEIRKGDSGWEAELKLITAPFLKMVDEGRDPKDVLLEMRINKVIPAGLKYFKRTMLWQYRNKMTQLEEKDSSSPSLIQSSIKSIESNKEVTTTSREMFGTTPADILAFTKDVTVEDILNARPLHVKLEAQKRVQDGEMGSAVWFKHMRKAGGSTIRGFLENVYKMKLITSLVNNSTLLSKDKPPNLRSKRRLFEVEDDDGRNKNEKRDKLSTRKRLKPKKGDQRSWTQHNKQQVVLSGFTLHHQEFELFPIKCLVTTPNIVYITTIRDPISRIISLFFYDGPGRNNPNVTSDDWLQWIDDGLKLTKFKPKQGGKVQKAFTGAYSYLPNYFTLSLTNQCQINAGVNSCARDNRGQSDFDTPGCRITHPISVTNELLSLAQGVLAGFDLVLVVEHLDLQGSSLQLQRALNVPGLWLGHSRTNARPRPTPPPHILQRLREENDIDIKLHEYAKEYSLSQFESINKELGIKFGEEMNHFNALHSIQLTAKQKLTNCLKSCRSARKGSNILHKCTRVCFLNDSGDEVELAEAILDHDTALQIREAD